MYMQPKCPSSVLLLLLLLVCWGLVVFFSGCNVMWCPCVHLGQMEQFFFPPLTPPQQQCCYCPQCACCITGTACVTAACCWPIMGFVFPPLPISCLAHTSSRSFSRVFTYLPSHYLGMGLLGCSWLWLKFTSKIVCAVIITFTVIVPSGTIMY